MFKSFKKRNTWDLITELFRTDFKLKYNDSLLGFIWVLVKPFSIFLIMYFVLTRVFTPSQEIPNFTLYLLLGNMVIGFWNEGTTLGMDSLLSRAGLITKVTFPRYIVLVSATLLSIVNFFINLLVFIVLGLINHISPSILETLWFVFCILNLYLLILAVSMFISIAYVKFRDLKQIWELFNQLLFWATPIFYTIDSIAHRSSILYFVITKLNPIAIMLNSARDAILYNKITYQSTVFIWFGIICVGLVLGYIFYKNSIKRIAEFF
jgi:ABC-2 type transport system permease protein